QPTGAMKTIRSLLQSSNVVLRVPAMAASERQRDGKQLKDFGQFRDRLTQLGLEAVELLRPMGYLDLCYIDWCVYSGPSLEALEREIHEILFPAIAYEADRHCPVDDAAGRARWRNAKCDVQSMWCHIHYPGDIYVTRDANFHKRSKKPRLESLGARIIAT